MIVMILRQLCVATRSRTFLAGMFWAFLIALATICPNAHADQTPMTDGEAATLCQGESNLPWASQHDATTAGYWVDAQNKRGAISWDLIWNNDHTQLKIIVYTYDKNAWPIWLATPMNPLNQVGNDPNTWVGVLNKYTSATPNGTKVGSVAIRFFQNDPTKVAMRWDWSELTSVGLPAQNECLNDFISVPPTYGVATGSSSGRSVGQIAYSVDNAGVNQPFTGYWNLTGTANSVPGFALHIMQPSFPLWNPLDQTPNDPPGIYVEHDTLITWDTSGNPVWLFADMPKPLCSGGPTPPYNNSMPCDPPPYINAPDGTRGKLTYPQPLNTIYPGGFPYFTACDQFVVGPCTSKQYVGTLKRTIVSQVNTAAGANNTTGSIEVALTGNPDNLYDTNKPDQVLNGTGFWPTLNASHIGSASLTKISHSRGIVPVQYSCRTVTDAPTATCPIWIAWHWPTLSTDTVSLYRHDLSRGTYTLLGTGQLNEYMDSLHAYDRMQYELWSAPPTPTTLPLDRTGEVRGFPPVTTGTEPPLLPDSPPVSNALPEQHDPTVGTAAGEAGTEGGAATYTVPIAVPPGRNGMQPEFALSYNSRSGNGLAGVGWSLSGASSIHRCPQTKAQDGVTGSVAFNYPDKLCLDGQRLVLKTGSYGLANATYRTEIDSFAEIKQNVGSLGRDDVNAASMSFTVKQKNGRTLTYGGGAGASGHCPGDVTGAFVPPGAATNQLSWLLRKITDPTGNQIDYCYDAGSDGETVLQFAYYTGTSSAVGSRKVAFNYTTRPSTGGANGWSSSYIGGTRFMQSKQLSSIETWTSSTTRVKQYRLTYTDPDTSAAVSTHSGRSLLKKIEECDALGSTCKSATTALWSEAPVDHIFRSFDMSPIPPAVVDAKHTREVAILGDLDGDGSREVLVSQYEASGQHSYLAKYDADRNVQGAAVDVTAVLSSVFAGSEDYSADVDGDGRTEIFTALGSTTQLHLYKWKLARGAALPPGSVCTPGCGNFFTDVNTMIPLNRGQQINNDGLVTTGDFDGNGLPDVLVSRFASSCASTAPSSNPIFCIYLNQSIGQTISFNLQGEAIISGTSYPTVRHADINGDGVPDLIVSTCDKLICGGQGPTFFLSSRSGIAAPIGCGPGNYFSVCTSTQMGMTLNATGAFNSDLSIPLFIDINGDGLTDLLFGSTAGCVGSFLHHSGDVSYGSLCAQLSNGKGFDPVVEIVPEDQESKNALATVGSKFRYFGRMPIEDVDGDGRPDILYPQKFAARICRIAHVTWPGVSPTCGVARSSDCDVWFCPENPPGDTWPAPAPPNGIGGVGDIDGRPIAGMYSGTGLAPGADITSLADADNSAYILGALHIVQKGPQSFAATSTSLDASQGLPARSTHKAVGSFNSSNGAMDLYGDGLSDYIVNAGCLDPDKGHCHVLTGVDGPTTLPDGSLAADLEEQPKQFLNENVGYSERPGAAPTPPEMLAKLTNGIGDYAQWTYFPLSSKARRQATQTPAYAIKSDWVDSEHYPFTSSMLVVTTMAQNNPSTLGARTWYYGYEDAVYNHLGRGFQGFRKILQTQITAGNQPLQIATTYFQKFPLAGQVQLRQVGIPPASGTGNLMPISTEENTWSCYDVVTGLTSLPRAGTCNIPGGGSNITGGRSYFAFVDTTIAKDFDLTSALGGLQKQVTEVDTYNAATPTGGVSGWDSYGNLLNQQVVRKDMTDIAVGAFVAQQTTDSINTYVAADPTAWWINRLSSNKVTKSISYRTTGFSTERSTRALPSGAIGNVATVQTDMLWNSPDRTLLQKSVRDTTVGGLKVTTDFTYPTPSYGLPRTMSVVGTVGEATSPRVTTLDYTSDGYFINVTHRPLSHDTSVTTRPEDGQPTLLVDESGLRTSTLYDALGNVMQVDYFGSDGTTRLKPSVKRALVKCVSCNGDTTTQYKVWTVQDGAPLEVTWFDFLNRELKRSTSGLDGTLISTVATYDTMGNKNSQTAPFFPTAATYTTLFTYDVLHRMTSKVQPTAELNSAQGNVTTTYTYTGNETKIDVAAANCTGPNAYLCFSMRRYTSVVGDILRTVDAKSGVTDFWYDAAGRTIAISDAAANPTVAIYDALGNRKQLRDPNQGVWNFSYNDFGESISQTDARGVVTTTSHDALGRVLAQTATPPASLPTGLDPNTVADSWSWDIPSNGLLESVTRKSGIAPTQTQTWKEAYNYDAVTKRVLKRSTTIVGDATPFVTQYRYDARFGRQKSITYPSGFTAWKQYGGPNGDFGDLTGLADGDTLAPLWGLYQANEYREPTYEQYGYVAKASATYAHSSGQALTQSWTPIGGTFPIDQLAYKYDVLGNLAQRDRSTATSAMSTETYTYDNLMRLTKTHLASPSRPDITYSYDNVGNLMSKSDVSASLYTYGGSCGPNFATSAGAMTYTCDANGNVVGGTAFLLNTYNAANLPTNIKRNATTIASFSYDTMNRRSRESTGGDFTYFAGDGYERYGSVAANASHRHELGPVVVTMQSTGPNAVPQLFYEFRDRLGSTIALVDDARPTTSTQYRDYDAFGAVRNPNDAALVWLPGLSYLSAGAGSNPATTHGFTDHEHVDNVKLIHMNGRVYDYTLGRFLSVDPIIQNKANSQNLNPYSYIGNNPLSGTDPTGYEMCTGSHIDRADNASCQEQGVKGGSTVQSRLAELRMLSAKISNISVAQLSSQGPKGSSSIPVSGLATDINVEVRAHNWLQNNLNKLGPARAKYEAMCAGYAAPTVCTPTSALLDSGQGKILPDEANPALRANGHVRLLEDGKLWADLTYTSQDISQSKADDLANQVMTQMARYEDKVTLRRGSDGAPVDLTIRGIGMAVMATELDLCDCAAALGVQAYTPRGRNQILINTQTPLRALPLTGLHEFEHFLGREHRKTGLMTWDPKRDYTDADAAATRNMYKADTSP